MNRLLQRIAGHPISVKLPIWVLPPLVIKFLAPRVHDPRLDLPRLCSNFLRLLCHHLCQLHLVFARSSTSLVGQQRIFSSAAPWPFMSLQLNQPLVIWLSKFSFICQILRYLDQDHICIWDLNQDSKPLGTQREELIHLYQVWLLSLTQPISDEEWLTNVLGPYSSLSFHDPFKLWYIRPRHLPLRLGMSELSYI